MDEAAELAFRAVTDDPVYRRMLRTLFWCRVIPAMAAIIAAPWLPHASLSQRVSFVLLVLFAWIPWSTTRFIFASRFSSRAVTVAGIAIDLLLIFLLQILIPPTTALALFAYLLIVALYTFLGGPRSGFLIAAVVVALTLAARFAEPLANRPNAFALTVYWTTLVSLVLLLGALRERLDSANAELAQSNNSIRRFLAMASHELRTPLGVVIGFASALREHGKAIPESDRTEYLSSIERQSLRMGRMMDDMLTLSQIDSGALEANKQGVAVRLAAETAINELSIEGLHAEVSGPSVNALIDPDHLHQILTNFLTNALKYGAPPYRVEIHEDEAGVEVRVSDRGPGVPPSFVPNLFEPFARPKDAREQPKGTGLGLSIVRALATLNGAVVWYEPMPGGGSVFAVRLQRSQRSPEPRA